MNTFLSTTNTFALDRKSSRMPSDPRGVVRFPSEGPGNQHPTPRARLRRTGPPAALAGAGGARGLPGRGRRHAGALPRRAARGGPPRSRERPDRARPPPGARRLARAPRIGSEARRGRGAPAHAAVGKAHRRHRAGGLARRRDPAAAARRRAAPAAPHRRGARPRGDVRVPATAGRRPGARRSPSRQPPGAARGSAAADPVRRAGGDQGPAMKARLEMLLRRLGAAGVLGIGVLLACAGFYVTALAPLEHEAQAQRLALERLRARTPHQPVSSGGRADELRRFYNLFPPASELSDDVERLHRIARSYAQLRAFLGVLLTSMPTASIDALRFERKKAADTQLEAQVRVTLHARPS